MADDACRKEAEMALMGPGLENCRSPAEVNETTDEELDARVTAAIRGDSDVPQHPFLTNALLHRVHTSIWRRPTQELAGWDKQRSLAKVVAIMTGGKVPSYGDRNAAGGARAAGTRMDLKVGQYCQALAKLVATEKSLARRARSKGKEPKVSEARVALQESIYHCEFGCTPLQLP